MFRAISPTRTVAFFLLASCSSTPSPTPPASTSVVLPAPTSPSNAERAAASVSAALAPDDGGVSLDIIYVPTPQIVVDRMLEVAKVTSSDVVYDLGCGDGRIVVTAAKKLGATGIGFDLDPDRVREARDNVQHGGVGALVSIRRENVFAVDLLPELNVRLIPQLERLRPGSRIVSHDFDMEGVIPDGHWTVTAPEFVNDEGYSAYKGGGVPEDRKHYVERPHEIYLWTVPLKKVATRSADGVRPATER